ncbi:MAG: hypothetical protein ACE5EM_00645 [Sphingomonadales bacterium]
MSATKPAEIGPPIPSATILLLRDSDRGLEVFMVKRHHQIDFASGALVFPGGKVDPGDMDPALGSRCAGAEHFREHGLGYAVAAIREAFEESGVLLARGRGYGELITGDRLTEIRVKYRDDIASGVGTLADMVADEDLILACDLLVPFAHWVTPEIVPKRFETRFFLVGAHDDHRPEHDGSESVDSLWIRPADALTAAEDGDAVIVFPTRLNLEKLARANTVAEAIEKARREPIVRVLPTVFNTDQGAWLRIPDDVGYETIEGPVDPVLARMKPKTSI